MVKYEQNGGLSSALAPKKRGLNKSGEICQNRGRNPIIRTCEPQRVRLLQHTGNRKSELPAN
jgi:hypothetical protein